MDNVWLQHALMGVRGIVCALMLNTVINLCRVSLFVETDGELAPAVGSMLVAVLVFGLLRIKKLNRFHPALRFLAGAVVGVVFGL